MRELALIQEWLMRLLVTAGVVSVFLAVLLFPAKRWLERRYAPQVRWQFWCGIALLLISGEFFAGIASVRGTELKVSSYRITLSGEGGYLEEFAGVGGFDALTAGGAGPQDWEIEPSEKSDAERNGAESEILVSGLGMPADLMEEESVRGIPVLTFAGVVWLTGAVMVLLWRLARFFQVRRRLERVSRHDARFEAMARRMGVRASIRLIPELESPIALGLIRPLVFLPDEVDEMAVQHELTHIVRRDIMGKALIFLACALYWFDPLVWYMARVADADMESACDACVAKDMSQAQKRAYGELLLTVAAGTKSIPLSTRFGGGRKQMKSRLTQLFCAGKDSRVLMGALLAAAFLLTGLVACQSEKSAAVPGNGVFYALYDSQLQEDNGKLTLWAVDFAPGAFWVGGTDGIVTLPVADGVNGWGNDWQQELADFLCYPARRDYKLTYGMDVLRVKTENDKIVALDWIEGVQYVGGVLWEDEDYAESFPYVLQLPESWRDKIATAVTRSRDGEDNITSYSVEFYRKNDKGDRDDLLLTITAEPDNGGIILSGLRPASSMAEQDAEGQQESTLYLGRSGNYAFSAVYPSGEVFGGGSKKAREEYRGMLEDAKSGLCFVGYMGGDVYTNVRYGFTLQLPESWRGHWYVAETEQHVSLMYKTGEIELLNLSFLDAPVAVDEMPSRVNFLGRAGDSYVYSYEGMSMPAPLFQDMTDGLYCQLMREDYERMTGER